MVIENNDDSDEIIEQMVFSAQPPGFRLDESSENDNIRVRAANKKDYLLN